jgi:hypothetical protein
MLKKGDIKQDLQLTKLGFPTPTKKQFTREINRFYSRETKSFKSVYSKEEPFDYVFLEKWSQTEASAYQFLGNLKLYNSYERIKLSIKECGTKHAYYDCECDDVTHFRKSKRVINYCHSRFCTNPKCIDYRIMSNLQKLKDMKIRSKKVYNFTLGSDRLSKEFLAKCVNQIMNNIPSKYKALCKTKIKSKKSKDYGSIRYSLRPLYIKVLDFSKSTKKGNEYIHYHITFFPKSNSGFDMRLFLQEMRIITSRVNKNIIFSSGGYASKKSHFNYLSKRLAGQYGHKKEGYFYLKDMMEFKYFIKDYHNKSFFFTTYYKGHTRQFLESIRKQHSYNLKNLIQLLELYPVLRERYLKAHQGGHKEELKKIIRELNLTPEGRTRIVRIPIDAEDCLNVADWCFVCHHFLKFRKYVPADDAVGIDRCKPPPKAKEYGVLTWEPSEMDSCSNCEHIRKTIHSEGVIKYLCRNPLNYEGKFVESEDYCLLWDKKQKNKFAWR